MKRSVWARLLAVLLVFSMLPVNASAAMWDNWFNRKPQSSQSSTQKPGQSTTQKPGQSTTQKPGQSTTQKPSQNKWPSWGNKWPSWGNKWPSWGQNTPETEPTEPEVTEPEATAPVTQLTVVESAATVENGQLLRASTYERSAETVTYSLKSTKGASTTKEVYFPVTMYNYDQDTINAATDAKDSDLTVREGLYFSDGGSEVPYTKTTSTADMSAFVAGEYYIQNIRAAQNNVGSWLQAFPTENKIYSVDKEDATVWTLEVENGSYYLKCQVNGVDNYMKVGTSGTTDGYSTTKTPVTLTPFGGDSRGVQIGQNGYYLCQWGGDDVQDYGGYNVNNDSGNGMLFYPVDSDTPIAPGGSVTKITYGYEEWNRWDKASGNNNNGDLFYTGLVQSELVNDQIVFNVPDGGIFNSDNTVKDIYEYVGLPFVLNTTTGVYTFDSDVNGAYFNGKPQSGTAEEPHNLHFAEGAPQPMPTDLRVGDGSTNAFFPFNNQSSYTTSQVDYLFGMRADIPFSMTPNGRIKSTDDDSTPIHFTFSGDDDVWIFIDGLLVIDLGGIHNRLDATIDFAANTVIYSEKNAQDGDNATGSYNDPGFATTQQLFTANGVEGIVPMSRDDFAADTDHEMQVFYLERGKGTSNARIEFNLPMHDSVIVTKDATKSWSQAAEDADLAIDEDDPNAGVDSLTDAEQAIVNNIDFGFTLYKNGEPVRNTNFYLQGRDVTGVVINSTDANGHFYLKNGQSAKFITEIPQEGITYYVVEDQVPDGFVSPDFNYAGEATYAYSYTGYSDGGEVSGTAANGSAIPEQIIPMPEKDANGDFINWPVNKSYEVIVSGSIESSDTIEFICSNFLNAELPNPTALTYEDIIVLDYGLPVQIDPLANDVFRGENIEIVFFGDDSVTLNKTTANDGKISATWEGDKKFHSGSVTLNDVEYKVEDGEVTRDTFTYTMNKQLTDVEVISYVIKVNDQKTNSSTDLTKVNSDYALGKIYIVPATVMYYEEDFTGLVTFEGSGWQGKVETAGNSDFQEPGVVGNTNDSIYGSDVAYLNDSFDSNGTSYYGDTTEIKDDEGNTVSGAIRFTYTFTGTGTTVFARTSATTGYVQFKLYQVMEEGAQKLLQTYYRDTYYYDDNTTDLDAGGTLYNIPIYTQEDLDYGTYTLVGTVAKAGTKAAGGENGSGKDFYLDGIRVMEPLNYDGEEALVAKADGAYAADGESNLDTVTLRYKLITDHEQVPEEGETETNWPFAVMTDTNGAIVYASDYKTVGPKEEVYLLPGQSVSFTVKYWHPDGYRIHMGMKAPFGNATVNVGEKHIALHNAADCYYDITGLHASALPQTAEDGSTYYVATYTFTAVDKVVSLTNIKITGNYDFVLIEDTDVNVDGSEGDDGNTYSLRNPEEEEVVEEETTETPEVENTETETPEVENTETETPEVENTETETPEVENTETETPDVGNTENETPAAENTETESDEVVTTDVEETDEEA